VRQLEEQLRRLQQENSNLSKVNRELQKKMLEHNLDEAVLKARKQHIMKQDTKKSQMQSAGPQIASLEEQITVLNSRLQE
jgi:hypothetical protein